jgi:hypothetical protein
VPRSYRSVAALDATTNDGADRRITSEHRAVRRGKATWMSNPIVTIM